MHCMVAGGGAEGVSPGKSAGGAPGVVGDSVDVCDMQAGPRPSEGAMPFAAALSLHILPARPHVGLVKGLSCPIRTPPDVRRGPVGGACVAIAFPIDDPPP